MADILLLAALFVVCLYYEKKNKDRRSDDEWLYCCRKKLINIENQFRNDCQKLSEDHLKKYTSIVYLDQYRNHDTISDFSTKYCKKLERLMEDYLQNEYVKNLPEYLQEEYRDQIERTYREHRNQDFSLYWKNRKKLSLL